MTAPTPNNNTYFTDDRGVISRDYMRTNLFHELRVSPGVTFYTLNRYVEWVIDELLRSRSPSDETFQAIRLYIHQIMADQSESSGEWEFLKEFLAVKK